MLSWEIIDFRGEDVSLYRNVISAMMETRWIFDTIIEYFVVDLEMNWKFNSKDEKNAVVHVSTIYFYRPGRRIIHRSSSNEFKVEITVWSKNFAPFGVIILRGDTNIRYDNPRLHYGRFVRPAVTNDDRYHQGVFVTRNARDDDLNDYPVSPSISLLALDCSISLIGGSRSARKIAATFKIDRVLGSWSNYCLVCMNRSQYLCFQILIREKFRI